MVDRKEIPMAMGLLAVLLFFVASSSFHLVRASDDAEDAVIHILIYQVFALIFCGESLIREFFFLDLLRVVR